MDHEDMFRLHLSGAGEYRDNKLIINRYTLVEFIDGFSKYILYEYWSSGKLCFKAEYSNGKQHGKSVDYYLDEITHSTWTMLDGKRHGECLVYSDDGSAYYRCNYVDGKLQDERTFYNRDGSIQHKQ